MAGELNAANFDTVAGPQVGPTTIASAATIAPTSFLTFITGNVAIVNITPPLPGYHFLIFIFTAGVPTAFSGAGNIKISITPIGSVPCLLVYNPVEGKYYAGTLRTG